MISVVALIVNRLTPSLVKAIAVFTLIVSCISFGLVARTGYLGGQIRHTEIATGISQGTGRSGEVNDDDDEPGISF